MAHLKKTTFRFFFLYFLFTIAPWTWLKLGPGISKVIDYINAPIRWLTFEFNDWFLHVRDKLNLEGYGSGDTSYAWAEFYTIIILAFVIATFWSLFDKNEKSKVLEYWLHNMIRYNIIFVSFWYGIVKLFALQMPFPNLSQMATPLGDLLPMRFSWMFIGYSEPYQFFSGLMECMVGMLLLYRRTIPLGLIIGFGVFLNVFVLNLCYDIPVKLYSMQIVICCLFLLIIDCRKYINFFILNKATVPTTGYNYRFTKRWQRIGRIVLKSVFICLAIGYTLYDSYNWYHEANPPEKSIIPKGVYNIVVFKKNNTLTAIDVTDSLSWKDIIFDRKGLGSIKTADTVFNKRYGRGYFTYETNKDKNTIAFKKNYDDSVNLFTMKYKLAGKDKMVLEGQFKNDTVYYELIRNRKNFPLEERQFHWISEANR